MKDLNLDAKKMGAFVWPILILVAIILLLPLLKGVRKTMALAGSIIGAPADFVDWMNNDLDKAINPKLYTALKKMTLAKTYNPKDDKDVLLMKDLQSSRHPLMLSRSQRDELIKVWKLPLSAKLKGAALAGYLAANAIKPL